MSDKEKQLNAEKAKCGYWAGLVLICFLGCVLLIRGYPAIRNLWNLDEVITISSNKEDYVSLNVLHKQNAQSKGEEVWIKSIQVNSKNYVPNSMLYNWFERPDGTIGWRSWGMPEAASDSQKITIAPYEDVIIEFLNFDWCGYVQFQTNFTNTSLDLYRPGEDDVRVLITSSFARFFLKSIGINFMEFVLMCILTYIAYKMIGCYYDIQCLRSAKLLLFVCGGSLVVLLLSELILDKFAILVFIIAIFGLLRLYVRLESISFELRNTGEKNDS